MKKRVALILAIAATVILLVLVALPFLIDVNRFRPELESKASLALNRQVKLGHLSLSVFSGQVAADDIEVADDPAFSKANFITAKSLKIGVELKPLIFSRQLNITEIVLESPQIALIDGGNGTWNFSSLVGAPGSNLDLSNAQRQTVSVGKFKVNHGRLTVQRLDGQGKSGVYDNVTILVTNFSTASAFPFELGTSLPSGGGASFSGTAGPISTVDAARTPLTGNLKADNVNIAAYGLSGPAGGISGTANLDETLQSDGTKATLTGTVTGSGLKLSPKGPPAPRVISVKHNVEVDLATQAVTIQQADIAVGKAVVHATGTFNHERNKVTIDLQLNGANLSLDELQTMFPTLDVKLPSNSHLQGGEAFVSLRIKGSPNTATISGDVKAVDFTLVGFNLGSQLGTFMGLAGKTISSPDTTFRSFSAHVQMTKAGIQVDNLETDIPSVGGATGSGTISPSGDVEIAMMSTPYGGVAGGLTKMATAGGKKSGEVPILLSGTIDKPVYTVDTKAATRVMTAQAAKGVASKIGGIFKKKPKQTD
jgi:AsmA protein